MYYEGIILDLLVLTLFAIHIAINITVLLIGHNTFKCTFAIGMIKSLVNHEY